MKKIILLTLTTIMLFLSMTYIVYASNTIDTLVLHYFRYDQNYTNYNAWLWQNEPEGLGGIQHEFTNGQIGTHGAFIEIDLVEHGYENTTRFGVIIKRGGWDGYREPGGDRFFDLKDMEVIDNKVHAYIVEQDLNIGLSTDDLNNNIPDYSPKILEAYFTKENNLIGSFSHDIESYKLYFGDNVILENNASGKNLNVKINNISLTTPYKLEVSFKDSDNLTSRIVSIQNLYDTKSFEDSYTYDGELGALFNENQTTFRLWAPISEDVTLNIYNQGHPKYDNSGKASSEELPVSTHEMKRIENGAWEVIVSGNLANKYYTFSITNYGVTSEVTDPYSYSTGANGLRSMIVDFNELNPENWSYNKRPNTIKNLTDYIVYELHVRDLTSHSSWNGNEDHRGKFLGFTDTNTTYELDGLSVTTGLDHIIELGVNAVQLLPIFDFGYVDEIEMALNPNYKNTFNWGYMPYHFNTLEGSYSTNPFDGSVRVNEFKQLVNALHENDIRVIMDVVYNHTGDSDTSNFHKILPGYYHRMTPDGGFYNGSGTGNETASERSMVRNFMLDSIKFLATEYNLSGFRFDLMELHDVETMRQIEDMLHEIDPSIVLYGEPWKGGDSPLSGSDAAGKNNLHKTGKNVGAFNDNTRDAIKGSTNGRDGAWVQGQNPQDHLENIKYGIVGGIDHPDVHVHKWHLSPARTINYVSAHDNLALHDKLRMSGVSSPVLERQQIQANAMVLTSQGIPFLHAGVEMMRSKPMDSGGYDHNSYESPDSTNQLRWDRKARYNSVYEYYKTLIQIRKTFSQLRMIDANDIKNNISFINTNDPNVIAYTINHQSLPSMVVIHNGNGPVLAQVSLPANKTFKVLTSLDSHDLNGLNEYSETAFVFKNSTSILVEKRDEFDVSLIKDELEIKLGGNFNPIDNIKFNSSDVQRIYSSSFYDVNVGGRYIITVNVIDINGNVYNLNYLLKVGGSRFNVNLKGDV